MKESSMVTFTKFGSCICSELFNFLDIGVYKPRHIHTETSISVLNESNNIKIYDKDIFVKSPFWKKMQKLCFQNEGMTSFLAGNKSDYFLFDLCDERLPLQRWKYEGKEALVPVTENTWRTSQNVLNSDEYADFSITDWHFSDRNKEEYKAIIERFCDEIKKHYDEDHIIYVAGRQAKNYIAKRTEKTDKRILSFDDCVRWGIKKKSVRERQDKIIEYAEKIVLENMPNIWKIELPANNIADERNKWGLHTLHFNHLTYEYLADCVSLIAKPWKKAVPEKIKQKYNIHMDYQKHCTDIKIAELLDLYG